MTVPLPKARLYSLRASTELQSIMRVPLSTKQGFEATIKSAKKAIKAMLGNADITDKELYIQPYAVLNDFQTNHIR